MHRSTARARFAPAAPATERCLVAAAAALLLIAAMSGFGCAAERTPVSAVPQRYSYIDDGRTLGPAPAPAATADGFLRPTIDRPADSLRATAAVERFQ